MGKPHLVVFIFSGRWQAWSPPKRWGILAPPPLLLLTGRDSLLTMAPSVVGVWVGSAGDTDRRWVVRNRGGLFVPLLSFLPGPAGALAMAVTPAGHTMSGLRTSPSSCPFKSEDDSSRGATGARAGRKGPG